MTTWALCSAARAQSGVDISPLCTILQVLKDICAIAAVAAIFLYCIVELSIGGKTFKNVVSGEQFGKSVNWVIVCIPFTMAAVAVQLAQSLWLSTS